MTRIIIVDDNADIRESLRLLLVRAGYEAETARHGDEAIAMHRRKPFQIVLTDIYMPQSDGIETIQSFRRATPGVRIIAMSGGGNRAKGRYLGVATEIGADATLDKPFTFEALLAALSTDS